MQRSGRSRSQPLLIKMHFMLLYLYSTPTYVYVRKNFRDKIKISSLCAFAFIARFVACAHQTFKAISTERGAFDVITTTSESKKGSNDNQ
jgi:hypothetical protein